jgi:hypothetical protein
MEKILLPPQEIEVTSTDKVSDGFHTFGELYEHRITLFIALCKALKFTPIMVSEDGKTELDNSSPWRSKRHSDGEFAFGGNWFVLGMFKTKHRQITYHLPIDRWEKTNFAETLDKAPDFDGHTSGDVLIRIKNLF